MNWKLLLVCIFSLGLVLRIWHLGEYPATLYGDEQAFAWNAYNILRLGEDEYGTPYPIQFRSFDDYKAPIPVYLLVPFISAFGLNPLAVRLPIALAAALTIPAAYLLARGFFSKRLSLLVAFLLAVSPWHLHVSRGYFETTLALFFIVCAHASFVRSRGRYTGLLLSHLFFALSLYSYFTPRIFIPLFLPFLYGLFHRYDPRNFALKKLTLCFLFLIVLAAPLLQRTLFGKGASRLEKLTGAMQSNIVTAVNRERTTSLLPLPWKQLAHNKLTVAVRMIHNNYFEQLSINYWYLFGDSSLRYFLGNMGMFYIVELPFAAAGLYLLTRNHPRAAVLFLGFILIAAFPAAIVGKPFALRSLGMLPAPFFFVAYGIASIKRMSKRYVVIPYIISSVFTVSLGWYLVRYYFEYPVYGATWWGWENHAALSYAKEREHSYDYIFISDFYSGATLAYAVSTGIDPLTYRQAIGNPITMADGRHLKKIGKYYFGSLDLDEDRLEAGILPRGSLYIGRPEEADSTQTINAPDDGRILFKVHTSQ